MSEHTPEIDPTLPEVVRNFLESGGELEEIRLDERGKWTHEGLHFENPRLIDLFSRSVGRTEGGTWVLEIHRFTYPITVEDTGFFVDSVDWTDDPPTLRISDGTTEPLDITSIDYQRGGRLYCRIKDGEFRARFKRSAYHSIMEHLHEDHGQIILTVGDEEILLADIDELEE